MERGMMMQRLDGPFIAPQSGKAKQLVVILHGYGDSGEGILGLGHEWMSDMPDAAFVAPNGVAPCEAFAGGYQWFSIRAAEAITTRALDRKELIQPPTDALNAYIDGQLAKWGVDDAHMAVAGFSQGAMMAMYAMPRRKKPCAGVIGYSGLLADPAGLTASGISKMPVLAIHGAMDDVVIPSCLDEVEAGFSAAGFDVETVSRPGLGHSIDQFGLIRGLQFMQEQFEKADEKQPS